MITNFNSYPDENDFLVEVKGVDTKKSLTVTCSGSNIEIEASRIINEDINEIISDLKIETILKEQIGAIMFSNLPINKKRISIRKLKSVGLDPLFIAMFIRLLEFMEEV